MNAVWALEMRFEPEPGTPRQARREIARVFAEHPRLEEILLCVSEVVSNAVLHARTEITLAATRAGDVVRVEVSDLSDVLPTRRQPDRMSPTGRGLHLLDMRTADWGVDLVGRGKTVWFEITSASPGGADV